MIHVIRHAHAGSRRQWNGDDRQRPLSPRGRHEAERLAEFFGTVEPLTALLSSPYLRCIQTLEPVAAELGLEITVADWLAEGTAPEQVLGELRDLDPFVALCSHGDVIGDLVGHLASRGLPMNGPLRWAKASVWHLDVAGGRVLSGSYAEPAEASSLT